MDIQRKTNSAKRTPNKGGSGEGGWGKGLDATVANRENRRNCTICRKKKGGKGMATPRHLSLGKTRLMGFCGVTRWWTT